MGYTHIIKEKDIPLAWFQCIYDIYDDERALSDIWKVDRGSYAGQLRREFKSILIEIENPCDPDLSKRIPMIPEGKCIPNPIDPVIFPTLKCSECGEEIKNFKMLDHKFLATPCNHEVSKEYYEMYRPTCEGAVIKYFSNYLFSSKLSKNELYTYGARIMYPINVPWRIMNTDGQLKDNPILECLMQDFSGNQIEEDTKWNGINFSTFPQYYYLCAYLKTSPQSNQIVMQIAQPEDLALPDPPCLRYIQVKEKEGKLNWFIYYRSWDLWGGLPLNLCGLSVLLDQMCCDTGYEPGKFICQSAGLHLYDHSWSSALARIGR